MNNLEDVLNFAFKAHKGQFRKDDKTPYVLHPIEVFQLLRNIGINNEVILSAALLHDCIEENGSTYQDIFDHFGKEIANVVDELSIKPGQNKKVYIANLAKNGSIEAICVKLVDRLVNIKDFLNDNNNYAYKYASFIEPIADRYRSIPKNNIEAILKIKEDIFYGEIVHKIIQYIYMYRNNYGHIFQLYRLH